MPNNSDAWKITMPIDTFENPLTGSVIDIVSVMHIAEPAYYRRIGEYIMNRQADGFVVHYEDITASDETELRKGVLGGVKSIIYDKRLDLAAEGQVTMMMSLGYVDQPNEGLFNAENSTNYDLADGEILAETRITTELRSLLAAMRFRRNIKQASRKGPEELDRYVFGKLKKSIDRMKEGRRRPVYSDKLIIDRRNKVALEGVDETLSEKAETDVVLIWGLGHFAGLSAGLIERGYSHGSRQEVTAITSYTVLRDSLESDNRELRKLQSKADRAKTRAQRLERRYSSR